MIKRLTILSSILLVVYCAFGFYLPTLVKEIVIIPTDNTILKEVKSQIEHADSETLKRLTMMMLNDIESEKNQMTEVLDSMVDIYDSYNKILFGLLLMHFGFLLQFLSSKNKPNQKTQPTPKNGAAN